MTLMKVTILIRTDEDPSQVLDEVGRMIEDDMMSFEAELDPQSVEDGCAVCVEVKS